MALYAFDGTWDEEKTTEDPQYQNTNVVRFKNAYHAHSGTDDFYVAGVGTRGDLLGHALGGAFGLGELPRLDEAYDHLCRQWAAGDRTIDIVGFSRGAATTLDFCHIIQERHIRKPGTDTVVEANPSIRFLGVWDVVAAFGLANLGAVDLNIGHHITLPASNLEYAFHALALDERRPSFIATRLQGACEVWFRGVHSDVGGGDENRGLNDIALKWMMSKAKAAGLPIAQADIDALQPNAAAPPRLDAEHLLFDIRLVTAVDRRHYTVADSDQYRTPPATCPVESPDDERKAIAIADSLIVLPPQMRAFISSLYATAERAAAQLDFPLDGVREGLLGLFQARVPLIKSDEDLHRAANSVVQLVSEMVIVAGQENFHQLNDFFLTKALFELAPLFPFTD
jgi:type VI secretion system (T6SS) phospholipase Tle1-like effector